jgi:hypothetical protein
MSDSLHHYTTFAGLDGIFRHRELWATDIQFLNDTMEFQYAVAASLKEVDLQIAVADADTRVELCAVRQAFEHVSPISSYVVSFTEAHDDLSMWRGYSKAGGGVALAFQRQWIEKHLGDFKLCQCIYDEHIQAKSIREMIARCIAEISKSRPHAQGKDGQCAVLDSDSGAYVRAQLLELTPILKHPKFREEREWRLVLPWKGRPPEDLRVRLGLNTMIPYTVYKIAGRPMSKDPEPVLHFDGLLGVLVGPNLHAEQLLTKAIRDTYVAHKISSYKVSIGCSKIPYRTLL